MSCLSLSFLHWITDEIDKVSFVKRDSRALVFPLLAPAAFNYSELWLVHLILSLPVIGQNKKVALFSGRDEKNGKPLKAFLRKR